ncbi:glutathione synthase [Sulfuritortus calidifontis]|uniref:Glutathione synthetase n=1 Tax=Sulfuritortus calidifontis TaxID=1914471 RepID=A0A4R3JV97_9PROT|nr:glutathione synthase [Sulfuritortus calidifontis]TCS71900.1 glutathione synthase [Sulfuritortus calidifontis]
MQILFVADPLASFKIRKDSTFAMMQAAAARGHELWACEPKDLAWRDGKLMGRVFPLELTSPPQSPPLAGGKPVPSSPLAGGMPVPSSPLAGGEPVPSSPPLVGGKQGGAWFAAGNHEWRRLSEFDAVLMRKDPPFGQEYLYATYLLELAEREGARVFNRPQSLRDFNEKLAIARFPRFIVPTLVSSRAEEIRAFLAEQGDIVLKPLNAMGGASVFRMRPGDANIGVIIETLTQHETTTVMAQRYIPEIKDGDKRILIIDGEAVPYCLARIPAPGETRGNLAAGGTGVARPLSERDWQIARTLGPQLKAAGLLLVGLDVIGDWLTEVNVTSPTCFREIMDQTGFDVAGAFLDVLERACA